MTNHIHIFDTVDSAKATIGGFNISNFDHSDILTAIKGENSLQIYYNDGQARVAYGESFGSGGTVEALQEGSNSVTLDNLEISMFVENGRVVKNAFRVVGQTDEALLFTGLGSSNAEVQLVTDSTELTDLFPGFETSDPSEPDEPSVDVPTQGGVEVNIGPYKMSQSNPGDFTIEGADFSYAVKTSIEGQLLLTETGSTETSIKNLEEGYNYTTLESGVQLILHVNNNTLTDAFTRLETQPDEVVLLRGLDTDSPTRTDISGQAEVDRVIPFFDTEASRFERVEDAETNSDSPIGLLQKIDGDSADWGWSLTQDGQGIVIWNDAGFEIFDALVEQLEFNDRTVDLTSLFEAEEAASEPETGSETDSTQGGVEVNIGPYKMSQSNSGDFTIEGVDFNYAVKTSIEGQLLLTETGSTKTFIKNLEEGYNYTTLESGVQLILHVSDNTLTDAFTRLETQPDEVVLLRGLNTDSPTRTDISGQAEVDRVIPFFDTEASRFERVEDAETNSDSPIGLLQKIDGDSADWGWSLTQDGQGIVIWNDVGFEIFDALVEQLEFNDRTVDLTPLFETEEAASDSEAHVTYVDFSDEQEGYEMDDEIQDTSFTPLEEMAV